ncbi:MAG: hypothetical protein JWN98_1459 [Abditibacteriota bacterium]|nr:hypothetical protein [Abditibacteriota bacterium]
MIPTSYSWVELHGATTHFPIVLLMLACVFDIGAIVFRKPAWREMTLIMLIVAVATLPLSLLSGYMHGREYARAPIGYDLHWIAAVVTSVLALVILLWRMATRDKLVTRDHLQKPARIAALILTMASASAVSFTGFMGGQMVFGDREAPSAATETVQAPPDTSVVDSAKLGAAANRMASAAGRLETATGRLGVSAAEAKAQLSKPAPAAAPASATSPATDAKLSEIARAAQNLESASARFEQSAAKLERIASDLSSASSRGGSGGSGGSSSAPPKVAAAPPAANSKPAAGASAAAKPAFDPVLVAAGEKVLRSEDHGCLDCHKFNGEGRAKGPDLTFAGRLHGDIEWQIAHLKDPASKVPGSKMPAYDDMSEPDLRALSTFLASRR